MLKEQVSVQESFRLQEPLGLGALGELAVEVSVEERQPKSEPDSEPEPLGLALEEPVQLQE